jgi:hypothetical protein
MTMFIYFAGIILFFVIALYLSNGYNAEREMSWSVRPCHRRLTQERKRRRRVGVAVCTRFARKTA